MYPSVLKQTANPQFIKCARYISTSTTLHGRTNFRSIFWDKRGSAAYLERRKTTKHPLLQPHDYGDRKPGIKMEDGTYQIIPEMIPDIIVPDLTGFKLKPYVSYRAPDVKREEFTAKHLFASVYRNKMIEDYKNGDLLDDATPKNPSREEKLTAEEALQLARQSGSDLAAEDPIDPQPVERRYLRRR